MTRIEGFNDPVAHSAGTFPIGYLESVMEGSRPFVKPMFLITGPMKIRQEQKKRYDLRLLPTEAPIQFIRYDDGSPVIDGITISRKNDKKRCETCGRGTHLQFKRGKFYGWRRCRKHLSPNEKALLFLMLTEAEAGGLTNWDTKIKSVGWHYRIQRKLSNTWLNTEQKRFFGESRLNKIRLTPRQIDLFDKILEEWEDEVSLQFRQLTVHIRFFRNNLRKRYGKWESDFE